MKSYLITNQEREYLKEQTLKGGKYNILEDINGDFFIWELEHMECGLGVQAEFIPPPEPEEGF